MEVIANVTFEDQEVALDGRHFKDCVLRNCILTYSGEDTVLERTLMRGCRHVFYGQARAIVNYSQQVVLLENTLGEWAEFDERVN